jgi:hypothetical protein
MIILIAIIMSIGVSLFSLKQSVIELESNYKSIQNEIMKNEESLHVLKAEWSYLNDPRRIQQLSEKYLPKLHGIKPEQIQSLAHAKTFRNRGLDKPVESSLDKKLKNKNMKTIKPKKSLTLDDLLGDAP